MFIKLLYPNRRSFYSLSEKEIVALAISSEEEDQRIYLNYAEILKPHYPDSAKILEEMAKDEKDHYQRLIKLFKKRFGTNIPLIKREHVKGFYERSPDWLNTQVNPEKIRNRATLMEEQSANFYKEAVKRTDDASTRKLLYELFLDEIKHKNDAQTYQKNFTPPHIKDKETMVKRKNFLLTWIQPGLAGLMDGSISTLAPIFAAAFATHNTQQTFLVGLSASLGAGISMGFTEAVHDDGRISGRGSPLKRGLANGIMTTFGGLGHTFPYLIRNFSVATGVSFFVVVIELFLIAWIQKKYMETPFHRAAIQVILGGLLVFIVGIFIGNT